MSRKVIALVIISALALGVVIGTVLQRQQVQTGSAENTQPNNRVYVMNVAISAMPFWNEPKHMWERIGSVTPGLRTEFGGPSDSDPAKQINELETLLTQKVDGMVIFSTDPNGLVPTIDKAVEKNIPVVTIFADVPKSKRLAYIGANQIESARAVGKKAMEAFPDRVTPDTKALIVVGKVGAEDQDARRKGFEEEISGKMKLVPPVIDDYAPEKAAEAIRAAMTVNPDIKFIFGCDSQSAIGAISALKEIGKKPGDVIVTGWDSEAAVLKEIKTAEGGKSWVYATAVLQSDYMVQAAFSLLEAAHFGYLYPEIAKDKSAARLPVTPQNIEVPMNIITPNNVDMFTGQ